MNFVCSIALIFFTAVILSAQQREISETEFNAIVADGKLLLEENLRKKAHRITSSFAATGGGSTKPLVTILETFERGSKGETRSRRVESVSGVARSWEAIRVGEAGYTRAGGGKWSRDNFGILLPMTRPLFGSEGDGFSKRLISREIEYFHLGARTPEREEWEAYMSVETRKVVYEMNGNDLETKNTNTYYFRNDGTMAQHDLVSTGFSLRNGAKSEYRFIVKWEIDPIVVIAAPEIAP